MSTNNDSGHRPDAESRRLADWIARNYDPGPMGPAKRAAFDRALEERLERRTSPGLLGVLGVVAASTVAVALWIFTPGPEPREESPAPIASVEELSRPGGDRYPALYPLLYSGLYGDTSELDEADRLPAESLPEDYQLLASAFEL